MAGRPKKYTDEYVAELTVQLEAYIDETDIPILKEWCYQAGIPSTYVYEIEGLSEPIKRCLDKKEAALERKALNREIDHTMAIFSLKQLGWRDKQDHNVTGEIRVIKEYV